MKLTRQRKKYSAKIKEIKNGEENSQEQKEREKLQNKKEDDRDSEDRTDLKRIVSDELEDFIFFIFACC